MALVSRRRVSHRPGRYELQAVKRRLKEFARLMVPGAEVQARLLASGPGGGAGGGNGQPTAPGALPSGGTGKESGSGGDRLAGTGQGRRQPAAR